MRKRANSHTLVFNGIKLLNGTVANKVTIGNRSSKNGEPRKISLQMDGVHQINSEFEEIFSFKSFREFSGRNLNEYETIFQVECVLNQASSVYFVCRAELFKLSFKFCSFELELSIWLCTMYI